MTKQAMAAEVAKVMKFIGRDYLSEFHIREMTSNPIPLLRNSGIITAFVPEVRGRNDGQYFKLTPAAQILADGGVEIACRYCGGRGVVVSRSMTARNNKSDNCMVCMGEGWTAVKVEEKA